MNYQLSRDELLASYWLMRPENAGNNKTNFEHLKDFAKIKELSVSEEHLEAASEKFGTKSINDEIDGWIVMICFLGHPHNIWNFTIDAVSVAENDDHLMTIAAGLAEHMLAHYGSMIPYFEARASEDSKFGRMLTGVWRHRMSDNVWKRLRALQAAVPNPLPSMIALERGVDHMSHSLSSHDRSHDDKGPYFRDEEGQWQK